MSTDDTTKIPHILIQANSNIYFTYLQASRYPLMTEVGWIFDLTNSSAFFSNSAAMITLKAQEDSKDCSNSDQLTQLVATYIV